MGPVALLALVGEVSKSSLTDNNSPPLFFASTNDKFSGHQRVQFSVLSVLSVLESDECLRYSDVFCLLKKYSDVFYLSSVLSAQVQCLLILQVLALFSLFMKYQKRDLARTTLRAKILHRQQIGSYFPLMELQRAHYEHMLKILHMSKLSVSE